MARRRNRKFDTFSLSFLDCMSCGFGAVVLFFMIISATMTIRQDELNKKLSDRADSLKVEVSAGELNLVELRNRIDETEKEKVEAQGLARRIVALLEQKREELARMDKDTTSQEDHINKLKADLKQLEEANRRLAAASATPSDLGTRIRQIEGEGQRQYLTGMKVGGERVMILLDTSASMLDENIVNVIRRRNMPDAQKIRAPKWQRALRTVEWVVAQFEPTTRFQIVSFNTQAISVLPDTDGEWLDASDPEVVESAMTATRRLVPQNGTSLHHPFAAARSMNPPPDNIFLIVDSLPTQGESPPSRETVSGRVRLRNFNQALGALPGNVPVNVILFPMVGDAAASTAYWRLAQQTNGSYMSPARDWP